MIEYLRRCVEALRKGALDGTRTEATTYDGSPTEVALYNAAADAVRIVLHGKSK